MEVHQPCGVFDRVVRGDVTAGLVIRSPAVSPVALRRHLRRFDTLTAAIWTVLDALYGAHPVPGRSIAAS